MSKIETIEEAKRHEEALHNAQKLLTICHQEFSHPVDALLAMVLASATLAYGIGMPLDKLLQGISAAYNDVSNPENDHATH